MKVRYALLTVIVRLALVVWLLAASLARAVTVAGPLATVLVSQVAVYGLVGSVPTTVPLTRKSTWLTPTLSLASAASGMLPLTVAPSAGSVRLTAGGAVSGLSIVIVRAADVVVLPAASVARALIVAGPLARLVVS